MSTGVVQLVKKYLNSGMYSEDNHRQSRLQLRLSKRSIGLVSGAAKPDPSDGSRIFRLLRLQVKF